MYPIKILELLLRPHISVHKSPTANKRGYQQELQYIFMQALTNCSPISSIVTPATVFSFPPYLPFYDAASVSQPSLQAKNTPA